MLLIVCQDRATAAWAAEPIVIGPAEWPTMTVRPLVLGPHNVPVVTDPVTAAEDIPLATFSVITHGKAPNSDAILKALATALKTVDEETARIFSELTELGLGTAPAAQTWRNLMAVDLSFFRSETSQRLRAEGRATGRAEGRAEDVLRILERRGVELSENSRERIASCTDLELLGAWLDRSLTAVTESDLFDTHAETDRPS